MNKVHLIDNMEFMKTIPDKYFDLLILDPPYGIKESNKNHKSRNTAIKQKNGKKMYAPDLKYKGGDWDNNPPCDGFFEEVKRVSKHWIIWGANYFKQLVDETFNPIKRNDIDLFVKNNDNWIIWDKCNGSNDFNDTEMALHNFNGCSIKFVYMWAGMMQGKSISEGNIMQGNKKLNEKRIHPTQKPVALYKWLLKNYAKPGDKIFDSHVGSGSIRIACHDMGFDFTGCEIDEDYWRDQEKRFNNHIQQGDLFSPKELQDSIFHENYYSS